MVSTIRSRLFKLPTGLTYKSFRRYRRTKGFVLGIRYSNLIAYLVINNFSGPWISPWVLFRLFVQEFSKNLLDLSYREEKLFVRDFFLSRFFANFKKTETKIEQALRFHDERLRDPKELDWTYVGHVGQEATTVT